MVVSKCCVLYELYALCVLLHSTRDQHLLNTSSSPTQMYTTAYDWLQRTDAVSQADIESILRATGFNGRILGYNAANNSLLIEQNGVLKAAIATSVNVQLTCLPVNSTAGGSCPQQLAVTAQPRGGSNAAPKQVMARRVQALQGGQEGGDGQVQYAVRLKQWMH